MQWIFCVLPSVCSCRGISFVQMSLWSPCWRWATAQRGRGDGPSLSWSKTLAPKPERSPGEGAHLEPPDPPQDLMGASQWISQYKSVFYYMYYSVCTTNAHSYLNRRLQRLLHNKIFQLLLQKKCITFQHADMHCIVCSLWDAQHHIQAFFYLTFPLFTTR